MRYMFFIFGPVHTTGHYKESFHHTRLRLQLFPNQSIRFSDYLGVFYVKSRMKHKDSALQSFYNGIFFDTTIDRSIRDKINMLGVSHVVSLSGFHLSILWGVVYGLSMVLYVSLQQRYFPYRHALFDVGMVAILFLGLCLVCGLAACTVAFVYDGVCGMGDCFTRDGIA